MVFRCMKFITTNEPPIFAVNNELGVMEGAESTLQVLR